MANALAITINDLVRDGSIAAPTAQVLDTGSSPVTLDTSDLGGDTGRVIVEVTNLAEGALGVVVKAGDKPPAHRAPLGDTQSASIAQNGRRIFGPFESSRFGKGGKLRMVFTPAATIDATFVAYRLPKA